MPNLEILLLSLITRVGAAAGGFLLAYTVARSFGAEGLGQIAVFLSLLGFSSILARRGVDTALIRDVSRLSFAGASTTPLGLLHRAIYTTALPILAIGLLGALVLSSGMLGFANFKMALLLPLSLALLTVLALFSGYAKGMCRAWLAPVYEIGGVSLIAASLLYLAVRFYTLSNFSSVVFFIVLAMFASLLLAYSMVKYDLKTQERHQSAQSVDSSIVFAGRNDFTIIAGSNFLLQGGAFLLAAPFLATNELGLLRGAERLALLVGFAPLAINPVIAPRLAQLSQTKDVAELRSLVFKSMAICGCLASPPLLILLTYSHEALGLFGTDFLTAAGYLKVLVLVQYLAAILGPFMILLSMSGRERTLMKLHVVVLLLTFIFVPVLTAIWGANGLVASIAAILTLKYFAILPAGLSLLFHTEKQYS